MLNAPGVSWTPESIPDSDFEWLLRTLFAEPVADAKQVAA